MKSLFLSLIFIAAGSIIAPTLAAARDQERYCRFLAEGLSGFSTSSNVTISGSYYGGIARSIQDGTFGLSDREIRNAPSLNIDLGGISSALRSNSRDARIYRLEYENCMSGHQ